MAHYVTCPVCNKKFNRDNTPCVQVGARRWAHEACAAADENTRKQEDIDREELEKYIMQLFKEDYISPRTRKLLNQYVNEYKYTYSGIHKALIYFYEVKKNDISKANGSIAIVPYIYKDAFNYYYALWLAKQKNEDKTIEDYKPRVREIKIQPPAAKPRRHRRFSFFEEDR